MLVPRVFISFPILQAWSKYPPHQSSPLLDNVCGSLFCCITGRESTWRTETQSGRVCIISGWQRTGPIALVIGSQGRLKKGSYLTNSLSKDACWHQKGIQIFLQIYIWINMILCMVTYGYAAYRKHMHVWSMHVKSSALRVSNGCISEAHVSVENRIKIL